jgi:pimeloyl-ACP methyl ester carboxylesterase
MDKGEGRAELVKPDEHLAASLTDTGLICDYLRMIRALGTHGWILVQRVSGPDGVARHVLLMPGLEFGKPNTDTPQDLAGAYRNLLMPDSTYTRATRKAVELAAVPPGSDLLIIGHSEGGIAAMNLAGDRAFAARYRVTHVVAVGAPIDSKRPADPATAVISLLNEHDIIPSLDGRGPASAVPLPASWTEFCWLDPSHEFPLCHNTDHYIDNLATCARHARDHVDASIAAYRGQVLDSLAYALFDR